jgi:hypothetical protein
MLDRGDGEKSLFSESDQYYLLEQQLIVLMNTIPNRDTRSTAQFFNDEQYDFLAPLELLKSNSLCDYMLNKQNFIKN